MIGKRGPQRDLFDVGNVYDLALPPGGFHAQLALAAPRLFSDADFAAFYSEKTGRPSVPPSQLALMTLLQHEAACSDAEAVARSGYDLRWAAVLRRGAGAPLCAKSTFQLFRAHLILHDGVRTIFLRSIEEARRAGLLKGGALRIAVDTKPILGRGAVEDTYNLLASGIQQLARALASLAGKRAGAWASEHDLGRYFATSLKGSADLDWSDAAAREAFLTEVVVDARRLLRLASARIDRGPAEVIAPVRTAAQLLEQLLLQDVVETTGEDGQGHASVKQGTASGRVPSATDPEVRHGRKSKSKRFTGHKASIATDLESQLIVDAALLAGDAPDAAGLLQQVERVEANTGQQVEQTVGDCAYGSGATRQVFADAGRELRAKVPQENGNGGRFPKSAFALDLVGATVTCPGGVTASEFRRQGDGSKLFQFRECGPCALRPACTTAALGRTLTVHAQEALLAAAREWQQTPAGRAQLRARVVVEHRLARLAQLSIGQARYLGRTKTGFQLLLAATLANLRRTWNWEHERRGLPGRDQPSPAAQTSANGYARRAPAGVQPAPEGRSNPLGLFLTGLRAGVGHGWRCLGRPGREARLAALPLTSGRMARCVPSNAPFRPRF